MKTFICGIFITLSGSVIADDIVVTKGEKPIVKINSSTGTMIEFPKAIKVQASSRHFIINPVATKVDKKTGKSINLRIVNIRPKVNGAFEEVPFVLAGRKTVVLKLKAAHGTSRYHKILFPYSRSNRAFSRSGAFLKDEIDMMRAMLRDKTENGYFKRVIKKDLNIDGFHNDVDIEMVRRFEGKQLYGYVFRITNDSDKTVHINPHSFRYAKLNRSALMQCDHTTLKSCDENNSSKPGTNSCVTALRLVVRSKNFKPLKKRGDFPFAIRKGK